MAEPWEREIEHLRELIEIIRAADKEALRIANEATKEALVKAEQANEKRLELLNEFRGQSEQQQRDFLRIPEYSQAHKNLEDRVRAVESALGDRVGKIENQIATMEGRLLGIVTVLAIVAIAGGVYELVK